MAITEYEDQIQEIVNKSDHSEFIYDFLGCTSEKALAI